MGAASAHRRRCAKLLADAGMNIVTLPKTIRQRDIWGTDTTLPASRAPWTSPSRTSSDYIQVHRQLATAELSFVELAEARDAGWLTLNAVAPLSGADIVLIPEIPCDV
ncbi:MAG: 6-phosphofructokinase [Lachnospiraceae bacterium]